MVSGFLIALFVHSMPTAAASDSVPRPRPLVRRVQTASADNIINVEETPDLAKLEHDHVESVKMNGGGVVDSTASQMGKEATSDAEEGDEEGRRADAATNAAVMMQGSDASIRKMQGKSQTFSTCVDQASRRRSGLTCKQLSGEARREGGKANLCRSPLQKSWKLSKKTRIKANEAADTCCATCLVAPLMIGFGGSKRDYNKQGTLFRPEEMKFEQCHGPACQECASAANCWAGKSTTSAQIAVNVAAGSTFSHYRAVVSTKCPVGSKAKWRLRISPLHGGVLDNGHLMIYKNNILAKRLEPQDANKGGTKWSSKMITGFNKVQMDFHPDVLTQSSKAQVGLSARSVTVQFEQCLDGKTCLNVFGDGSPASFAMRNVNKNQIDCLDGLQMLGFLISKCNEWLNCLKGGASAEPIVIQFLRTFLHAARVHDKKSGEAKLLQDNRLGQLQNSEQCIDPAEADAEAMQCECMDKLLEKCGGVDEECFHETICARPGICQTWKDENCGSSMSSLGLRATRATSAQEELDASVQGKGGDTCD